MPPKRPRSHELETLSRNRLHNIFTQAGWVVGDLDDDYGEDLLVRIFEDGMATPFSFFVQIKATDHINRYLHANGKSLSFPIDVDHLEHWNQFWEPVIFMIWDAETNIFFWEPVQRYLAKQRNSTGKSQRYRHIEIPVSNLLDEKGIEFISDYTKRRFKRYEVDVQSLLDILEHKLDVYTAFDDQHGLSFILNKDYKNGLSGEWRISFDAFIGLIDEMEQIGKEKGITGEESFAKYFYNLLLQAAKKGNFKKTNSSANETRTF